MRLFIGSVMIFFGTLLAAALLALAGPAGLELLATRDARSAQDAPAQVVASHPHREANLPRPPH